MNKYLSIAAMAMAAASHTITDPYANMGDVSYSPRKKGRIARAGRCWKYYANKLKSRRAKNKTARKSK